LDLISTKCTCIAAHAQLQPDLKHSTPRHDRYDITALTLTSLFDDDDRHLILVII